MSLSVSRLSMLAFFALTGLAVAHADTKAAAKLRLSNAIIANFDKWDFNHDGTLDGGEMARVVQDPQFTGDAASAAAAVKLTLRSPKASTLPAFTRALVQSEDPAVDTLTTAFTRAESQLSQSFDVSIFNAHTPTLVGCRQGSLGDCYLIAATGAIITRDPAILNRMIRLDSDKALYHVTYGDGFEVDVPTLTEAEMAMGGASMGNGIWLRILEKAWGTRSIRTSTKIDPTSEPQDLIWKGGSPKAVLEAMTGHVAPQHRLTGSGRKANITIEQLRKDLQEAVETEHLAVAETAKNITPGISGRHAYAVLGFDPKSDEIQMWNPHVNRFKPKGDPGVQNGYPTVAGQFSMPLADFMTVFSGLAIETDQVKAPPKARS